MYTQSHVFKTIKWVAYRQTYFLDIGSLDKWTLKYDIAIYRLE